LFWLFILLIFWIVIERFLIQDSWIAKDVRKVSLIVQSSIRMKRELHLFLNTTCNYYSSKIFYCYYPYSLFKTFLKLLYWIENRTGF
jgi:hypothetical protein